MSEPTKIVVVSNDYTRDFYIPLDMAKAFYESGIISKGVDCGFDYMLSRCHECLLKNCKGGGQCIHDCHHYNEVRAEEVEKIPYKRTRGRPRGSKNKPKPKSEPVRLTIVRGDWSTKGTTDYLKEQLGFNIQKEGWFTDGEDFVLITRLPGSHTLFRADVWNGGNPMLAMESLLKLPLKHR